MLQFWGKDLTRSAPSNGPLSKLMSEEIIPGNEGAGELSRLLRQYGCGPIQFAGTSDALYERHLIFDNVVEPATAHPRERFEAIAHSVRDVLSQRWVHTERSYERENPKRVYYLSMEFLLGRSLANNLTNLLLDSFARQAAARKNLEWLELLEREPDAGLGNGGLGRLAACFLDSMATMELPAMSYGLRYEYGIFKQTIRDEPETRAALDLIFSDHFSRDERGVFEPLRDALLKRPIHAPGRPRILPRGGQATPRVLCRPGRLGQESHPQRGGLGQVLERSHDQRIRLRNLERFRMPGALGCLQTVKVPIDQPAILNRR